MGLLNLLGLYTIKQYIALEDEKNELTCDVVILTETVGEKENAISILQNKYNKLREIVEHDLEEIEIIQTDRVTHEEIAEFKDVDLIQQTKKDLEEGILNNIKEDFVFETIPENNAFLLTLKFHYYQIIKHNKTNEYTEENSTKESSEENSSEENGEKSSSQEGS